MVPVHPRVVKLSGTLALTLLCGCNLALLAPQPRTPLPSEVLRETGPSGCAAVLLPGRWDRMEVFRRTGFADARDAAGVDLGLVAAEAHIGYYRKEMLVPRLREDVIAPLRESGAERLWMVGTSLGGVGSLVYWSRHADEVAGMVLIAPYLGEDDVLEEIREAGGLRDWSPSSPVADDDFGRHIWLTLREVTAPDSDTLVVLAYGSKDELAPGHRLLGRELPEGRVFVRDGGHDWDTWAALWSDVLASGLVCSR